MIAVRDTIPTIAVKISTALVSNSIKVVSVNLMLRKPITLCCIYIPPCTDDLQLTEVIQYFSTLINSYPRNSLVLVGDFNLPDINLSASSTASRAFCDFIFDNALFQVVDTSTHSKSNIFDLIITNSEDSVRDLTIHSCGHLIISDHFTLIFRLSASVPLPLAPLQYMFMITSRLTTTVFVLFFLISTSPHAFYYHMMLSQYGTQSSRPSMKE